MEDFGTFWLISTNLGACFLLHWWWHQDGFGFSFSLNLWDYLRLSLFDVMMNPSFSIYSLLYNDFVIHVMKVTMNLNRVLNMIYWSLLGQTTVETLWFASFAVGSAGGNRQSARGDKKTRRVWVPGDVMDRFHLICYFLFSRLLPRWMIHIKWNMATDG